MSRTFKVIVICILFVPLALLGAVALIAGNPGTNTSAALMLLCGAIPVVLIVWWARRGQAQELHEFKRSLAIYGQDTERLDEPRAAYGGMTQRDMNSCRESVKAFILDGGLKERKPTSARQVKALLRDFFRAGLHLVDAQNALDDERADILEFFKERHKAHKKATPMVLAAPLDAPEVITVFALEMLNGKRVGKTYLDWKGLRAT